MNEILKMPQLPEQLRIKYGSLKAVNLRNVHAYRGAKKHAADGCGSCLTAIIGLIVGCIFV